MSPSIFRKQSDHERALGDRLPPGQYATEKWPVLHYGSVPRYPADLGDWRLRVTGSVDAPLALSYAELQALGGVVDLHCDIHCVTTWSRLDNTFTGIRLRDLLDRAAVRPSARFVIFRCAQGFTTSIPIEVAREDDSAVVWAHDGAPLAPEHGWPLRALVPRKYFWKSAKWLETIEAADADQLGFWERNGYNNSADPWLEERYW